LGGSGGIEEATTGMDRTLHSDQRPFSGAALISTGHRRCRPHPIGRDFRGRCCFSCLLLNGVERCREGLRPSGQAGHLFQLFGRGTEQQGHHVGRFRFLGQPANRIAKLGVRRPIGVADADELRFGKIR